MFIGYFCESKYKNEFLQLKYSRKLMNEFKHILEKVPESIVIYDEISRDVLMTNTEFQSLIQKPHINISSQ